MEFEDIYRRYWNKIFRLCMGYVNDYSLAQDMAQETFIKVWQYLPTFRNEANIDTWIFRIATNNCLRQLERKKQILSTQFPADLFEDEKKEYYIQKEQDEFESFKARRLRFANSYNKKFKGDD